MEEGVADQQHDADRRQDAGQLPNELVAAGDVLDLARADPLAGAGVEAATEAEDRSFLHLVGALRAAWYLVDLGDAVGVGVVLVVGGRRRFRGLGRRGRFVGFRRLGGRGGGRVGSF